MNNKEYTVSEVIDSFGMNKHTWLMFMLLALAMILDGSTTSWSSTRQTCSSHTRFGQITPIQAP